MGSLSQIKSVLEDSDRFAVGNPVDLSFEYQQFDKNNVLIKLTSDAPRFQKCEIVCLPDHLEKPLCDMGYRESYKLR